MTTDHETWNPRSTAVLENQVAAYDELRTRCPVAHDESGAWTLFRHAEVLRVALDHATFSSDVSSHLQVPNGMDPPAHTAYRAIVDRYYTPDVVGAFVGAPPVSPGPTGRIGPLLGRRDVFDRRVEPDVEDLALHARTRPAVRPHDRHAPFQVAGYAPVNQALVEMLQGNGTGQRLPVGPGLDPGPDRRLQLRLQQIEVPRVAHLQIP